MGQAKILRPIFNRGPFPAGGSENTLSQTATDVRDPFARPLAIANLRMVVDVGNWGASRFVLAGGISGNPCSRHYDDLLDLWKKGEGVTIAYERAEVVAATRNRLELIPST
jgi:penicillin amidase